MFKIKLYCLLILSVLINISCRDVDNSYDNSQLTIGTFNIAWLGDGIKDRTVRSESDYKHIAEVIIETEADILSLQEIENKEALELLIKHLDGFNYKIFDVSGSQNVSLLYKDYIDIDNCSVYYPLMLFQNKHRPGLYAECCIGEFRFKLLGVHFKSTSRYDDTKELKEKSRHERAEQAAIASSWADSVLSAEDVPIIIAGDFNDYPGRKNDYTLAALSDNESLTFLTEGMKSCKFEYGYSIDHIIVSSELKDKYFRASSRCYDIFSAYPENVSSKISDHCPITVNLDLSNNN